MKPTAAHKLLPGDKVSIDGYWLEVVRVLPTEHTEPHVMVLFLNGRSRLVKRDEEFLRLEDER